MSRENLRATPRKNLAGNEMASSTPAQSIAIVGAGALGRWLAATLTAGGEDVTLVTRPGTVAGITACRVFDNLESAIAVDVPSGPAGALPDKKYPWLLLCTKAADLEEALRDTVSLVRQQGTVAVLSNGLGHGDTARLSGVEKCVAATVTYGLFVSSDGSVHVRGDGGEIAIGPLDTGNGEIATRKESKQLAHHLAAGGLKTRIVEDGNKLVWQKAMLNAGINPVAALIDCQNGDLPDHATFALAVEAAQEARAVASSLGVTLAEVNPAQSLRDLCRDTATNRCSTLQDLDAQRRTEMDWICGAIERIARANGVDAPANRLLSALVREAEMAYETC